MKKYEDEPIYKFELPQEGDVDELAQMHIQAWKESYVLPESGLTDEKVNELLGHMLTNTEFRKKTIAQALENPGKLFYRIVRNNEGKIVGFFHGIKTEEQNELNAIYLLNVAKGTGTGGRLMEEFLSWADKHKPTRLEVFSFNDSVIGFYERYGFVKTATELDLYKELLPVTEMIRPADLEDLSS